MTMKNSLQSGQLPIEIISSPNYLSIGNIQLPFSLDADDPLESLGLTIRVENSLKRNDVRTVGQFCNTTNEKLFKMRNIGPKSMQYMIEIKKQINKEFGTIAESEPDIKKAKNKSKEISVPQEQLIALLFEKIANNRAKEVIRKRYGLMNGEKQTLEEIGESFGVTRERIRQIQAKALNRMKHPTNVVRKPLIELAEKVFFENGGILSEEEADIKIPKAFGGINDDGSSILDLFSDLGWIQNCKIGDIAIYSPNLDNVSLCELSENIISQIKVKDLGMDVYSITKRIVLFNKITDIRFNSKDFVLRYCRIDPRIEEIELSSQIAFRYYTASGHFTTKSWVILMTRVLEKEQMPLHFTEIADKVNDLMGNSERKLNVRRAHSIMIDDKTFAHSGVRGTYGLTSWGLRKETTTELVQECLQRAGFPIHWKQIFNYVSKYKDSKPISIKAVLDSHAAFERKGDGIYGLTQNIYEKSY